MGKKLSEMILDLGKCPNQKVHESDSAGAGAPGLIESFGLLWTCLTVIIKCT